MKSQTDLEADGDEVALDGEESEDEGGNELYGQVDLSQHARRVKLNKARNRIRVHQGTYGQSGLPDKLFA